MARRRRISKPKIFSTSLLDMLFCAFGGIYTLFVIGSALLSGITLSLPMLLEAQIDPINELEAGTLKEDFLSKSYLTFGIDESYISEIDLDTNFVAHYGYLNPQFEETRSSFVFLNSGLSQNQNKFELYAENLEIPLKIETKNFEEDSVQIRLKLFIHGYEYIQDTTNVYSIADLYQNQLPSSKLNALTPLLQFSILADETTMEFDFTN